MYHVGRPGEDGYAERVLAAWGIDGHNSHTNVCSSSGRAGYHYWMGLDRPSPDHANAKVILLISAHLESGHYFNPHAQRVIDGKANGAKLIVFDTRLSNTASHADWWIAPVPGSEAAILLAIASHLIRERLYDRDFVRRWWNWQEYLEHERPELEPVFERFEEALAELYSGYTFELAERESGVPAATLAEIARGGRLRGDPPLDPYLALCGGGQPRRLAGVALPLLPECPARRRGHGRRYPPERLEQVRGKADSHAAAPGDLERAHLARRVPAGDERAVVPAAPLPAGATAAGSTSTSRASTTRSGRTRTGSPGSRRSRTKS